MYFSGSTDVTAAVVAGTYETASLAPGAKVLITAKVSVKSAAARHSSLSRRVTLTSLGDNAKQDTVKLIAKRG